MKKIIITILFVLGIIPYYTDNGIKLLTDLKAQISGSEFWTGTEDCIGDSDIYCISCEKCYDSYSNSSCPNCTPTSNTCQSCGNTYSSDESHDCPNNSRDEGTGSSKYYYCPNCKQSFFTINDRDKHYCPYYH